MATSTLSIYSSSLFSPQNPIKTTNPFLIIKLHKPSFLCFSSKKKTSFMDQILDYIEGGPKLRKWYRAPNRLAKDGALVDAEDESQEVDEIRDSVLVSDGDSEIGQMVILSLIVKRARVKALVKDKRAALEAFGTYVELAAYRGSSGIQALMTSNAKKLAEQDESMAMASGIPYTIIRAGLLQNTPGGKQVFSFQEGSAAQGRLSKEDAAFISVEALYAIPKRGLVFEVVNGEEVVSDWKQLFKMLMKKAEQELR